MARSHVAFGFEREISTEGVSSWNSNSKGKRTFDLAVGVVMLIAFAPVMLFLSLLLFACDRGPIFFKHTRIGRNGREFACLKFRTMVIDADERLEAMLARDPRLRQEWNATRKLKKDPRIVPGIGALLRKSSLDELPQIFNVIRGDMTIVGPRPVVREELEYYGMARALYLQVLPGLTGPWQANERSDSSYRDRVERDVEYIQNGNMADDLRLVAKTATMLLMQPGKGTY
ncbi:sugar transferase [Marivita sp. GX14005]|uniref:sugar transferase n=1 Tax=Marivita sp. GX14005 TaxID=2942276 RepID=UPI00201A18DB|nr:sugar transferase [Marivita sp. GX14005]MCL3881750.1 sugar transferase [Marivita sp. GX14005]